MSSTFMGLNIGASALSAFQTSVNTTANNISNAKTEGYSRQTATLEATQALRVTAKYGSVGTGVGVTEIKQERDLFYDDRYWKNNSSLGLYESKIYYLEQIQGYFTDDDTQTGFSTLFNRMYNAMDTLITEGVSDESVRNQFINSAQNMCTYFNSLYDALSALQADVNEEIKSTVDNINAIGRKIALLNTEINDIEVRGTKANELRDERAKLLDELSAIVNVETTEVEVQNTYGDNLGNTFFTVMINGQNLVEGNETRQLKCVSQDYKNNQNDIDGLYHIAWDDTEMNFAATTKTAGGSLNTLFEIRDGNNHETLTGNISGATTGTDAETGEPIASITIDDPSIIEINKLAIASSGQLTIANRTYNYDSWTAELDEEGNITSYTFQFSGENADGIDSTMAGKKLMCGISVDSMGIPYYMEQINEFLRNYTEMFNDIEEKGVTLDGDKMGAFFVALNGSGSEELDFSDWNYDDDGNRITTNQSAGGKYTISSLESSYYRMTAGNVKINDQSMRNPRYFSTTKDITNGEAAYELIGELKELQDNVTMFRGDSASAFLETLLSDVAIDTSECTIFYKTYDNLKNSIGNLRTSISGVDEDEEALNLVKFQNAYNMASKIISVMSEMYDKLINQTGVT